MTRKEMFDLRIASDGFRYAVRKALFECSKFPPCTERMIVEGRLADSWSCDCRGHYRNWADVPVVVLSDSDDLLMRRCRPWN